MPHSQQMFTFTIGPAVLLRNRTDVQDSDENANHLRYPSHHSFATNRDPEHVGLLDEDEDEDDSIADLRRSPDQLEAAPDYLHPAHSVFAKVTGRMKGISGKMKPIKIMYGLLNAPMIGGVIALFLGVSLFGPSSEMILLILLRLYHPYTTSFSMLTGLYTAQSRMLSVTSGTFCVSSSSRIFIIDLLTPRTVFPSK